MKERIKLVMENTVKQRNPVAASLRGGQFKPQTVRDRTKYSRKGRSKTNWD